MLGSYFEGRVPEPVVEGAEADLPAVVADVVRRYDEHMLAVRLQQGLVALWEIVARVNQYLVEKEPWKLAKDDARRDELASVLYASAETLRILAILIRPIMPGAAERLWGQLGVEPPLAGQRVPEAVVWGGLTPGTRTTKGDALFPRLQS
jgi:methionyl-tRNA synthetase